MIACYCFLDSLEETLTGHVNELLCLGSDLSYRMGSGCIGMHALVDQASIDADDITLVKDLVLVGDGMNYFVIYGNTKGCRITVIIQEIRDASKAANRLLSQMVKFPSGDASVESPPPVLCGQSRGLPASLINSISFADLIVTDI